MKVVAVVVTRDRRELLRQSLTALMRQDRPVDGVIVVDNHSTDGTAEMLRAEFPEASVRTLTENQGGAGGFHEGIRAGYAKGADWLWLMDDDSVPRATALAELIAPLERMPGEPRPVLLCSRVEWQDGQLHPMNLPTIRRRDFRLLAESAREGLLPLRAATFVSVLIAREAVDSAGMPNRHYFWQADDIEYTARILRNGRGYFVPLSVVEHRTASKTAWAGDDRRMYFSLRNSVLMLRGRAWAHREKPALAWSVARSTAVYLRAKRLSLVAIRTVLRGLNAGFASPP